MKKIILASVMAFGIVGLAACTGGAGGGDKGKLVKACMAEEGANAKECECMADQAVKTLDAKLVKKLVQITEKGEENTAAIMGDLTPEQMGEFMGYAMTATAKCGADLS